MKLAQMKAFQEVMLTGSVTEAAKNLHRTQPSVSAMVANMEDELGMRLFERRNGRLHPVPEAQYLLEECSAVLERVNNISRNLRGMKALSSGRLEVVSMPGPSVFLLPHLISHFARDKAGMESTMISRSSDQVFQLVAAQQFDIGLADYVEGKPEETSLVNAMLFRFSCLCALHHEDPLASRSTVKPADLDGRPLAILFAEHEASANLARIMADSGADMNVRFTTQYFVPLLTFVEQQLAYGLVDPIAVASYRLYRGDAGKLVFRPIEPQVHYRTMLLSPAYRPASLLAQAFHKLVVAELLELGGELVPSSDEDIPSINSAQ